MKQETKDKIKKLCKYARIGVIGLCWLMALLGVSAYAIYWCKACANYQEPQTTIVNRKAPLYAVDNSENYYQYKYNSNDNLSTWLNNPNNFHALPETASASVYLYVKNDGLRYAYYPTTLGTDNYCMVIALSWTNYELSNLDTFMWYNAGIGGKSITTYNLFYTKTYVDSSTLSYDFDNQSGSINYITFNVVGFWERFFNTIYTPLDATDFSFNDMPNYNQLFSYQLMTNNVYKYNGTTATTSQDISYYINLTFMSNGVLFDRICLDCSHIAYISDINGNVTTYDNYLATSSTDFYLTLTAIRFQYYGTNRSIKVASLSVLRYENSYQGQTTSMTPVWLVSNGFKWIDNSYKYLSIANNSLNNATSTNFGSPLTAASVPFLNLTSYDALTFNYTFNGGVVSDIGLSNVFTLLNGAFSGIASLMSISIIPGITLGLLVFVPFIVTIIIVVLRLVKK